VKPEGQKPGARLSVAAAARRREQSHNHPVMLPRFFVPDLDPRRGDAVLPEEEGHHLARVLRLAVGDPVAVFDGRGTEFRARIASVYRDTVTVTLVDRLKSVPSPRVGLTLVQAVLKGESMDDVIRDCTMIGVETIAPVISERTTVKSTIVSKAAERWRRIALSSAKQCGRARLPEIRAAVLFDDWVRHPDPGDAFLLVEPAAALPNTIKVKDLAARPAPQQASLIVGPEGGWTDEERDLALDARCSPLSLGPLTLRADAVPLAASAALLAIWE
jgi:16S rRNA (uracil1498-N3)-methyltransferase